MSKKSQSPKINNLMQWVPQELAQLKAECPNCNLAFSPDLLKTQAKPLVPVKPNDHDGPGRWIPIGWKETCPRCQKDFMVPLPVSKMRAKVLLFGDEAYREHQRRTVYTYSVVGAASKFLPQIEEAVLDLKRSLCPSRSPDSWALHMKEMWSGQQRQKHDVFKDWGFEQVQEAVRQIFNLINTYKDAMFIYNIALTGDSVTSSRLRDESYILLVMRVIDSLTAEGGQPSLFFDAERPVNSAKIIQAWARDAFQGSQHCLLYSFLARGIEVPEPAFVPPASHPCLEIADFVSFVVARYHLMMWKGSPIDIEPGNLGAVFYMGFESRSGDLIYTSQTGYPWQIFYKRS